MYVFLQLQCTLIECYKLHTLPLVIFLLSMHVHAHYVGNVWELSLVEHLPTKLASNRWQQ